MAEQIDRINQKIERIETELEMLQKVVLRLIKQTEEKDIWTFITEVNNQREKDTLNILQMIKELKNGKN